MTEPSLATATTRLSRARQRREAWEALWRDCYAYALPQRGHGLGGLSGPGQQQVERMFDGTAPDAVEQLAASLLAQLTPPWSSWFGIRPGRAVAELDRQPMGELLDDVSERMLGHFHRSNFAVEIHQCFLDLVTIGTATLLFEEAPAGEGSAFRFTAIPASEMILDGGPGGQIRGHFRTSQLTLNDLLGRFSEYELPHEVLERGHRQPETRFEIAETVTPSGGGHGYLAFIDQRDGNAPAVLATGGFEQSPFISFRWIKGAGELYGRSPVMTALPDIKTANKVVELVLKNASIAATGIWQAEDDGVLNPSNVRLVPGAIIPKAPGSSGLTPLAAPGRFDVSQLVLDDLRGRIRHTLLVDRLGPVEGPKMTATEVLERSAETTRLLGAIYGRLQSELIVPLIERALGILARRGEAPPLSLDGRLAELQHKAPLARAQARDDVQNVLLWLESVGKLGNEAMGAVDGAATARWLAETLAVPNELIRTAPSSEDLVGLVSQAAREFGNDV